MEENNYFDIFSIIVSIPNELEEQRILYYGQFKSYNDFLFSDDLLKIKSIAGFYLSKQAAGS